MTEQDPTLRLPDLPLLSRELGSVEFPLQEGALRDADPEFTVAGSRAHIAGGPGRGVDEGWGAGIQLLSRLRVEGASTTAATLTPLGLERRLELGTATVVESVAVPRADPVCFFEWTASRDVALPLTWRIPGPTHERRTPSSGLAVPVRWRAMERGLLVDFGEDRALYVFSQAPFDLAVTRAPGPTGEGAGLEVRARLDVEASRAVRLVMAGITAEEDEARVLRVMDRTHVVVPIRRAEAARTVNERLAVDTSDPALADELAWSKVRLADRELATPNGAPLSDRSVRLVLAALASGDSGAARALTKSFPPAVADPEDSARHLFVAARYLIWTGDLRTIQGAWEGLRVRAERCLRAVAAGHTPDPALLTGALREMVVAAEEAGDAELTRRLRSAVGEPGAGVDMPSRTAVVDPDGETDALLRAAAVIEAVVHGLLGAEPDAPRGRLVLRPRLPGSWDRFAVRNLAVGGADVSTEYVRTGGTHRFTLRQERGAAPLRVILEAELEGQRVVAARVDGERAELDPVPAEGRLRVPVQVVLDHERRVEVEIQAADA